jgi:hypothetical protein
MLAASEEAVEGRRQDCCDGEPLHYKKEEEGEM